MASREQPQVAAQTSGRTPEVRGPRATQFAPGRSWLCPDDAEGRAVGNPWIIEPWFRPKIIRLKPMIHRFKNLVARNVARSESDQVKARYETLEARCNRPAGGKRITETFATVK